MNRLSIFLLFGCLIGMTSCFKDSYIFNRKDCPVLLQFSSNLLKYYFISPIDGNCLVSEIPVEYQQGDELWVDYTIHMKHQEYSNVFSATNVVIHKRIHSNGIKAVESNYFSDDFNSPIQSFFIKPVILNTTLYFGFVHKAPAGQTFEYEMLYDPAYYLFPAVYIKSRKLNEVTGAETEIKDMAGFEISHFVNLYRNENNELRFYIRYLSEINDGKEVYMTYKNDIQTLIIDSE